MLVRVHDEEHGTYFKSEVYAILSVGWPEQYLVLVPNGKKGCLKLFNYLSTSSRTTHHDALINVITPEKPAGWVSKSGAALCKIKELLCDDTVRLDSYEGYGWLLEKPEVITALLRGESVPADFEGFQLADSALPGWNYIKAQDDIDSLMELTHEFHDSCLERLNYISGAHVHEDGSMYPIDDVRSLKMVIGSQQCNPIELVFEGLIGLNLRPAEDNYDSIILRAVLSTKNETVFFADVFADDIELESGDLNEYCTCVSAFSLRWRFLGRKATVPDSPR